MNGLFLQVITSEAPAIRAAFEKTIQQCGKPSRIRLTIVVVQSKSNYRVFPAEDLSLSSDKLSQGYHSQERFPQGREGYRDVKPERDDSPYGGREDNGSSQRYGDSTESHGVRRGGGNAAAENVPPGTCVDSDVVHPTHTEFLLIPHKSVMVR